MTFVLSLLSLLLPLIQTPASPPFRVRLFSASQPMSASLISQGSAPQEIRAAGSRLIVDGRVISPPLRTNQPVLLRITGQEAVRVESPLEITTSHGTLLIIALIPREEYVAGVLAGEASIFRSGESLKAMAVAARTYALHFLGRHKSEGFDFCDTTHCQDYRGTAINARVRKAASDTSGELIWYAGTPIEAYYHQDCGGVTEGRSSYLPQIHDAFCLSDGRMQWTAELSLSEIESLFGVRSVREVAVVSRTPSGRASQIRITGSVSRTFQAEEFRLAAGRALGWEKLRSDLYQVRRSGDRFVFEGYGAGHGIGLCQNGAAIMGEMGHSYREILAYYYPNTAVGVTSRGISWIKLKGAAADLESTRSQDAVVLELSARLMRGLEASASRRFKTHPLIRIYPSVAAYRDATGEPGWVAASTKNNVIRLQPADMLRGRNALDSTLRHELAHWLLESYFRRGQPLWFREGLVLWLTEAPVAENVSANLDLTALERALANPQSEAELRRAYRNAQKAVQTLVRSRGKEVVLGWIERGMPSDVSDVLR